MGRWESGKVVRVKGDSPIDLLKAPVLQLCGLVHEAGISVSGEGIFGQGSFLITFPL